MNKNERSLINLDIWVSLEKTYSHGQILILDGQQSQGHPSQGFGGFPGGFPGGFEGAFEDLYSRFTGGFAGPRETIGEDILTRLSISFMDAAHGVRRSVTINPIVECHPCSGTGSKKGAKPKQCPQCRGSGQVAFIRGGFQLAATCPSCSGKGSTISRSDQCTSCNGQGRVREKKTLDVDIPAGIDNGMRVRLAGQGDAPIEGNGRPGDVLVQIDVFQIND